MNKRQFSEDDQRYALAKFGMVCFVANHPIDEGELEFDHIAPYAAGGASDRDNIAPVCRKHNRDKRDMSLTEYRDKLAMDSFFDTPSPRILNDVLKFRGVEYGQRVYSRISDDCTFITVTDDSGIALTLPLYRDNVKDYSYFYAKLPARLIQNDKDLQPRPLEQKRLWQLYRHLRQRTQLSPSIGRLVNNHIYIFDGQHKIAAQAWAGVKEIDCKIYLDPDPHDLMQTNLDAHYALKQMSFYSSIMVGKLAQLSQIEWNAFLEQPGPKSEATFVSFLMNNYSLSKANANSRLSAAHVEAILKSDNPSNRLAEYIAENNRNRKMPLTMSTMEKQLFKLFLTAVPVSDEIESATDYRNIEIQNIIRFMNMLSETTLENKWNPEANDAEHQKAERIYFAGSIRAWSEVLRDAIAVGVLQLLSDQDRSRIFYREVNEVQFDKIQALMKKLFNHTLWLQPWNASLEGLKIANNEAPKRVFKDAGLTASWLLGMTT